MAVITAVLLPGLDGTGELFAPFVDAAPVGVSTIVADYPTSEASVDILERHAREKITDHCIVIAESFSGPIGVRIAADVRVQALVLCNSFISSPIFPALRYLVIPPLFTIPLPSLVIRSILLGHQSHPALVENVHSVLRRLPADVIARRVRQVLQTNGGQLDRFPSPFSICGGAMIGWCRNAAGKSFKQSARTLRLSGFQVRTCCFRYRRRNAGDQL